MRNLPLLLLLACTTATESADVHTHVDDTASKPLEALEDGINANDLISHLEALQAIADANGGNRAVGYPGFAASGDYAAQVFEQAGYEVTRIPFSFSSWIQGAPTVVEDITAGLSYGSGSDIAAMTYSPGGEVTAALTAVDLVLPPSTNSSSTSGCESSDFDAFPVGNIALIQRGDCFFQQKVDNAINAGASAVVIFNEGQSGRQDLEPWQLDEDATNTVPVVSATFDVGDELAAGLQMGELELHIVVDASFVETVAENVIAQTVQGDPSNVLIVGGHLDSVAAGPGINDNGTGVATILELARLVAEQPNPPKNQIRFALWGGEELGLLGSSDYVDNLSADELDTVLANLNFDMMGSPNGSPMIYDGDGSAFGLPGPSGSDTIEAAFEEWFEGASMDSRSTVFDGRSDYYGFINNGIPAGGLFSGAEGIKESDEADDFGGQAGAPRDACYHQACDTIDNIDPVLFEQLAQAAAHATWVLANQDTSWAELRRVENPGPLKIPIGGCRDEAFAMQ